MTVTKPTSSLFHPGELEVQRRAGVAEQAEGLEGMLQPRRLDGGAAKFLAQRQFAVITARGLDGRLWTSPLSGTAGFLEAHGRTLEVHRPLPTGDPLAGMPAGQQAGVIAVEFALRRRFRVNGTLVTTGPQGLVIDADQAFGNCPSYIQRRALTQALDNLTPGTGGDAETKTRAGEPPGLTPEDVDLIRHADTFFLGTVHPDRGADTSHKGGRPGFVRVEDGRLWWPDYEGNNMFNSLGNITVNPEASLLFVDFATGRTLQLSGTADVEWGVPGRAGDDGRTGRRITFRPSAFWAGNPLPVRSSTVDPSPDNPPLKQD